MLLTTKVRPNSKEFCDALGIRALLWLGGSKPAKLGDIPPWERALVSVLFRDEVAMWQEYWREPIHRGVARTFWRRARYDAHATFRSLAHPRIRQVKKSYNALRG
jgi:hypothetical protein